MKKWYSFALLQLLLMSIFMAGWFIAPYDLFSRPMWHDLFIIFAVLEFVSPLYNEPTMSIWFEQKRLTLPKREKGDQGKEREIEIEPEKQKAGIA